MFVGIFPYYNDESVLLLFAHAESVIDHQHISHG